MRVEGIADELLARIVAGAVSASSSANNCCFNGSFSGAASNTKLVSLMAGAMVSCAEMRAISAASPPSSSRAALSRAVSELRHSADGS
jgi:hypothetical protein